MVGWEKRKRWRGKKGGMGKKEKKVGWEKRKRWNGKKGVVGKGTFGSQQQWIETLHWQTQHFRQEHREAQILCENTITLKSKGRNFKDFKTHD